MRATGTIPRPGQLRLDHLKTAALVTALVGSMTAAMLANQLFDFNSEWVWRVGYPALFLLGVIGAVAMVLPIPILPLVFAGASFLDPYALALSAAAGMTVGMALSYTLGSLGKQRMSRFLHDGEHWCARWALKARDGYEQRTVISSFFIAAVPNPVYSYSGIITGSMRVSMRRFCIGTFLGKATQATIVALAGFYTASSIPAFL